MYQNAYMTLPGITPEEIAFLNQGTAAFTDDQKKYFFVLYSGKRKSPQEILLFTLIGFAGVAGIQRFVVGEVLMGLLYLFTGGFCAIGTIVDLINYKTLASDYNRKMAFESYQMTTMGGY